MMCTSACVIASPALAALSTAHPGHRTRPTLPNETSVRLASAAFAVVLTVASLAYGTHSPRRTKSSIINRATGNLRADQILLGHSKIENTVRYLGIDVEDALALAENTEI